MSWIKIIIINILVLLTGLVPCLFIFETYLRSQPDKFHSYGWLRNNEILKINNECNEIKGKLAIFGDSFAEYYWKTENNIASLLSNAQNEITCNFGISGTGLDTYFARFQYAIEHTKISKAIVLLYEGNDFFEITPKSHSLEVQEYDRVQHTVRRYIKQSAALNLIYREAIKPFFSRDILFTNYNFSDCYDKNALRTAQAKIENLKTSNPTLYEKFKNNQLNVSWFQVALNCPNYFDIISQSNSLYENSINKLIDYVDSFEFQADKYNIEIHYVIIPHDYFVSKRAKLLWEENFLFNHSNHLGPTIISKSLINKYPNMHYFDDSEFTDYIQLDGHLTPSGNQKLATFIAGL